MTHKYEHLNERQMKSEELFKSWQSLWNVAPQVQCQFDPNAPEDEDPMPDPGRDNPVCLYNKDDVKVKYEIFVDLPVDTQIKIGIGGGVHLWTPPRHVHWKWLRQWAKAAQNNRAFKSFSTPYGLFGFRNHSLNKIYFPTDTRGRFTAQFETEIVYLAKYNQMVDHNNVLRTYPEVDYTACYKQFPKGVPRGCLYVNWDNIKDTYRYCYMFDKILSDEDKIWDAAGQHKFGHAKDMWAAAIWFQFNYWFNCMQDDIKRIYDNGGNRNSFVHPYDDLGTKENYCQVKDVPSPAMFKKWTFHSSWTPQEYNPGDMTYVNNQARSNEANRRVFDQRVHDDLWANRGKAARITRRQHGL